MDKGAKIRSGADGTTTSPAIKRKREPTDKCATASGKEETDTRSRRASARETAKVAATDIDRQATKRAIESIASDLEQGPRDGAEILRALRQRVCDKQAAGDNESVGTKKQPEEAKDGRDEGSEKGARLGGREDTSISEADPVTQRHEDAREVEVSPATERKRRGTTCGALREEGEGIVAKAPRQDEAARTPVAWWRGSVPRGGNLPQPRQEEHRPATHYQHVQRQSHHKRRGEGKMRHEEKPQRDGKVGLRHAADGQKATMNAAGGYDDFLSDPSASSSTQPWAGRIMTKAPPATPSGNAAAHTQHHRGGSSPRQGRKEHPEAAAKRRRTDRGIGADAHRGGGTGDRIRRKGKG